MSRTAVNVHATSVNTTNISRQDLVDWVNDTLGFTYQKVENFCTGKLTAVTLLMAAAALSMACAKHGQAHLAYCIHRSSLLPVYGHALWPRHNPNEEGEV